ITELLAAGGKEGTATRTSRTIAEELLAAGAEIATNATADAIFVTAGGLCSVRPPIRQTLPGVARDASFAAAGQDLAKANALQCLAARASTPEFHAQKALARAVYGDLPYHVVAPTAETLQAATAAQLRQEHARRFQPDHALLVVVGEFDTAA